MAQLPIAELGKDQKFEGFLLVRSADQRTGGNGAKYLDMNLTDRTGDDIHEADTRQELMSLSARFGLTVTFQRPEKARFETILEELARQHHIQMPMDQLLVKAEAFAIRAGGRSPRVAKQFIEQCEAGVQK